MGRDGRDGEAPAFSEHYVSDGARKEKLRQRSYSPPRATRRRYAELHAASAFSFLDGASLPEDLMQHAAELELPAVALVDLNGVYGAPRFYQAAKPAGVKALVGAEVVLDATAAADRREQPGTRPGSAADPIKLAREDERSPHPPGRDRAGYRNLCRLLTAGARAPAQGRGPRRLGHARRARRGLRVPDRRRRRAARARTSRAQAIDGRARPRAPARAPGGDLRRPAPRRAPAPPLRPRKSTATARCSTSRAGSACRSSPPTACATRGATTSRSTTSSPAIRHHPTLDAAGRAPRGAARAAPEERRRDGARSSPTCPRRSTATLELAARLDFTLADLGYRFPDYPLPPGETPASYLRQLTWNGARARFRPLTAKAQAQIQKELDLIEKLDLAGYFLIVWDIVRFCQRAEHPGPGPRLGGQQRGLLRARDHRGRSGEDGAPLRALPLRGARRVAGHRPRPPLGRPAREGHPVRLPALRRARRGDDRQRHHLPRPLGGARGGQGPRLLRRAGRQARRSSSGTGATTCAAATGKAHRRASCAAAGFDPDDAADPPLRRDCGAASRTCRATSASTPAAW